METNVKLPYLCISREDLKLMRNLLEPQEIGEMLMMLEDYFYDGVEPVFSTKVMKGVWENIFDNIKRRADGYLRKVKNLKQNKTKKTDIPSNTEFETKNENKGVFSDFQTSDDIIPQLDDESAPNHLKTSKNEGLQIPSNVINEMGRYANDDSIPINERYGNISRLFKPYSRNIPSHKINDYINSIYNKLREVA